MSNDNTMDVDEVLSAIKKTSEELFELISSTNDSNFNLIPFPGSWTFAQVLSHITKSNVAMLQVLNMDGKTAQRNVSERVPELESTFLNYSLKFQSPAFILPGSETFEVASLVDILKKSIIKIQSAAAKTNAAGMVTLPALGEITKYELLHFVLYHTQRHIHQLKNIIAHLHEEKIA
ncbi:MAG: DinB family protein [Ginsengibacter sp.]